MSKRLDIDDIILECNTIHSNKYDYSTAEYFNIKSKVNIICPIHGIFKQSIESHMKKKAGCPKCYGNAKDDTKSFIEKAIKKHSKKYDYSNVIYTDSKHKIKIGCKKHGIFEQLPGNHLNKNAGCPICNESKGEKKIAECLDNFNIKYIREYRFDRCFDKYTLPFDFFLTDFNTCIEYDGIQHFQEQGLFNSLQDTIKKDNIKNIFCKNNNIKLLRIKYTNFNNISKIIKEEFL